MISINTRSLTIPPREMSLVHPLHDDSVEVWFGSVDTVDNGLCPLSGLLGSEEISRAYRFHFEKDRRAFIARRSTLKILLGLYLATEPGMIKLTYGKWGKPDIAGQYKNAHVQFTISHSGNLFLMAFSKNRRVGIDVEHVHDLTGCDRLAQNFFTSRENSALRSFPQSERAHAFFQCWTRKEAVLKALGCGLSLGLSAVEVSIEPDEPVRVVSIQGDTDSALRWSLWSLAISPQAVAALAVETA
ncbi:MAG TPA: 4'-phosphopantetheinyl transferase superfamily protein [Thermodesulfobacteriota bacterium]|nr:4'-phosphopantetheinyl transferase superfamily protein [Deltaproteobacteria bacterium]HNR12353.1 4'-phosphopantetheinyl transferase superfamily protein [Thermodesulfobacteriota bacterium]HNU72483.1 4'-phosphopantetheinyl transferase superfamily protein [Thermodesulfobacteriota bacterium]HOC37689.1 4'-phosphopantetheinyl transferase superfamily protein [Thermodesulfobacteriota bacterium]HQO77087.1 4'-phosphopantetheinyl transferase superfamily protein [Thermodesulfobacteriota bacterium]